MTTMSTPLRIVMTLLLMGSASAAGAEKPAPSSAPGASVPRKRLDFDDRVVEGMNRRPLDSLTQLSDRDGAGGPAHLYKVPADYRARNRETLEEMRYQ
jgi:hypothetical protein